MHAGTSLGGLMSGNLPSKVGDGNLIPGWGPKIPTCPGATKPRHPQLESLSAPESVCYNK